MMTKYESDARNSFEFTSVEDIVPADHLVRKIEAVLDFDFIYSLVEHTYSTIGRPSVDPVVLVKMVLIQYLFGIRSMRQTIKEIEMNVAYRWFLGYGFSDKIPHFSTFGKNYSRRFKETDLFEQIFYTILKTAVDAGFVHEEMVYIDSTHIKANANKHRFTKKEVEAEVRSYQKELEHEINDARVSAGKKPFEWSEEPAMKTRKISTSDPESGYYVKGEREKQFAYSAHTACDEHGFILGSIVTPGNSHDSQLLQPLVKQVTDNVFKAYGVAADAAYKTPAITKFLEETNFRPILPYMRPKGKKGMFRKNDFIYDEHYDQYICPNDDVLKPIAWTREGYQKYVSSKERCQTCPLLEQCTTSLNHQKVILRHIWQEYVDVAEDLRFTHYNKQKYKLRKETIERVFADAKEKHGMRWTKYRGLEKVQTHTMLVFSAMNLKKLANWSWNQAASLFFYIKIEKTRLILN